MNDIHAILLSSNTLHALTGQRILSDTHFNWNLLVDNEPGQQTMVQRITVVNRSDAKAVTPWARACMELNLCPLIVLSGTEIAPDLGPVNDLGEEWSDKVFTVAVTDEFGSDFGANVNAGAALLDQPDEDYIEFWDLIVSSAHRKINAFPFAMTQPLLEAYVTELTRWRARHVVLEQERPELEAPYDLQHWRGPKMHRDDLSALSRKDASGAICYDLVAHPFAGVVWFKEVWHTNGLLPDISQVDPDGAIRRSLQRVTDILSWADVLRKTIKDDAAAPVEAAYADERRPPGHQTWHIPSYMPEDHWALAVSDALVGGRRAFSASLAFPPAVVSSEAREVRLKFVYRNQNAEGQISVRSVAWRLVASSTITPTTSMSDQLFSVHCSASTRTNSWNFDFPADRLIQEIPPGAELLGIEVIVEK